MINIPTLLILGAGASNPYGYPLGTELKDNITKDLLTFINNNNEEHWARDLGFSKELIFRFARNFEFSKSYSIDSFLAHQDEEIVEIGKIAIVNQISKCEDPKKLFQDHIWGINRQLLFENNDDWYRYLINKITSNAPVDAVKENKLEIITFNYDRSLEMCLTRALASFYSITLKESFDIIKNFSIVHMYGQLDPLPLDDSLKERKYGDPCSSNNIKKISNNIKIVHEAQKDKRIETANEMIERAKRIYFLGLDLRNTDNLGLLDLSSLGSKRSLATAYNLKDAEIRGIHNYLTSRITQHSPTIKVTSPDMKSLESIRSELPFK